MWHRGGANYGEGPHAAEDDIHHAIRGITRHLPPAIDTPIGGAVDDAIQHFNRCDRQASVTPSTPSWWGGDSLGFIGYPLSAT